jgi:recombination associated protein RdgC
MFKNASIFKITLPQPMLVETLNDAAQSAEFYPTGLSQERSVGWVAPRGHEHDAMVENVGGQLIMRMAVETRSVPAKALRDAVDAKVKHVEDTTGRKPGKKEKRELAEDTKRSMLPMAFANRSDTLVWIDPSAGLLIVDSASRARTDEVLTQVVKLIDGVTLQFLNTNTSPASAMASWLSGQDAIVCDGDFVVGRSCELKACDESKAKVRYQNHTLDIQQVRDHIAAGKIPTKLAMTYNDRVSFVLNEAGALTGINFLDLAFEDQSRFPEDVFDTDVVLITGELGPLIKDLTEAMGGEYLINAMGDGAEGGAA